jgi:hypothetical protein
MWVTEMPTSNGGNGRSIGHLVVNGSAMHMPTTGWVYQNTRYVRVKIWVRVSDTHAYYRVPGGITRTHGTRVKGRVRVCTGLAIHMPTVCLALASTLPPLSPPLTFLSFSKTHVCTTHTQGVPNVTSLVTRCIG